MKTLLVTTINFVKTLLLINKTTHFAVVNNNEFNAEEKYYKVSLYRE